MIIDSGRNSKQSSRRRECLLPGVKVVLLHFVQEFLYFEDIVHEIPGFVMENGFEFFEVDHCLFVERGVLFLELVDLDSEFFPFFGLFGNFTQY